MSEQVQDLQSKLESLQETWDNAAVAGQIPEGDYEGEVSDFDFFENRDGTELFLKTEIAVRIPREYSDQTVETINSLSHPERVKFVKEMLGLLGVDVTSLSMGDLIPRLREVVGTGVGFRVVHTERGGKHYQNVYINDFLFPPAGAAPVADVPADTDGLTTPPQPQIDPALGF